jgi:serine/threonine protein kinase
MMNSAGTNNRDSHSLLLSKQIDNVCDKFESACKSGNPRPLEKWLSGWDEPSRRSLFRELLLVELTYSQHQDNEPSIAAYESRFPEYLETIKEVFREGNVSGMVGKIVGHYRITAKLGAGGMGEVFLVEDTQLERQAAIKFLPAAMAADPERRQRFLREAKAASALNHPHVCVVYEVGETEAGLPFIVMELVAGESLDKALFGGPLEIVQVVQIAVQVADALDAAHASRIVHRDIKPANINLAARGHVKVLDFGLAKRMPQTGSCARHPQLHEPGTGAGQRDGPPHRPVQSGCRAV